MKHHPLKLWREAEGLTQDEAAREFGVTIQCWRQWEYGQAIPHRLKMRTVTQRTGVTADAIYAAAS